LTYPLQRWLLPTTGESPPRISKKKRGAFLLSALHAEVRRYIHDFRTNLGQEADGVGEDKKGYGDATKLEVWRALCEMVGIDSGRTLTACRKV